MFIKTMKLTAGAGLSVAWLALMAGSAMADDETPLEDDDEIIVTVGYDGESGDDGASGEEVGEPSDGGEDGLPTDEQAAWVDGPGGEVFDDGTVYDDPGAVPEDSECGGCEYWTTGDGSPVLENARGDDAVSGKSDWATDNGPDLFARGNICLDDAMYVGWLCDWQRPYLDAAKP